MMAVHRWSAKRSKSAIVYNKHQKNNNISNGHGRQTKNGKKDYHIAKKCPYAFCNVVRLRLGPHLIKVHKVVKSIDDYTTLLKEAEPWKGIPDRQKKEEVKDRMRRERLRSNLMQSPDQAAFDAFQYEYASNPVQVQAPEIPLQKTEERHISNEAVFNMFEKYMTSLDGGDLENTTANTYIQQVKSVMDSLKTTKITNLFEKKVMSNSFINRKPKEDDNPENFSNELLNKEINKYEKHVPSTKQKYLTALMHFCDFVSHHLDELKMVLFKREDVLQMKTIFANWRKSLNKKVQLHSSIRAEEDQEVIITPQHMKRWEDGEIKRKAIKLFGEFSSDDPPPLTKDKFCTMRDFFIVEVAIQNGHRSGVCSNMLISELNAAKLETVEDTTFHVLKVKKHKTLRTHGFAKVYMKQNIFNNLKMFVKFVLPELPGEVNHVFKTFFGRQMSSGEVSTQLNSLWMRDDVYENDEVPTKNISCTLFRKSISTMSLERQRREVLR